MRVLFITPKELKENGLINGSVDVDKFIEYLWIAQDIHITNFLGKDLYDRLKEGIQNDDLNPDEIILLDDYIKDALIHYGLAEYYPFSAYRIMNGGMYKHESENAQLVDKNEVDFITQRERDYAQYYTKRLIDYLCAFSYLYPEFKTSEYYKVQPTSELKLYGGWYLGDDECCNNVCKW